MNNKSAWQKEQEQEKLVIQLLNWTTLQVAQASPQDIEQALQIYYQQKKRELPALGPEPIVKLSWPKSSTCSSSSSSRTKHELSPPVLPTQERPPLPQTTPQTTEETVLLTQPVVTPPPISPVVEKTPPVAVVVVSETELENKHENNNVVVQIEPKQELVAPEPEKKNTSNIGKTPGFLRDTHVKQDATTTTPKTLQERCIVLSARLKQLRKRREDHDVLFSKPALDEPNKQHLQQSFDRTNLYIWNCLIDITAEKQSIVNELQTKQSLLSWSDDSTDSSKLVELITAVSNLNACLVILEEGDENHSSLTSA